MKPLYQLLVFVVCLAAFLHMDVLLKKMGGSVEMYSDSTSATMVTTDMFGNKKKCKTELIGSQAFTRCD